MMIGESLGPYQILEPLGAGGMGEVYLALDTRLRRRVAIKVLPREFASDPERLARFTQEARAAAALNHASIAAVHDVGEADGIHFMVQEYLQGSTLKDCLGDGALALSRSLRLAAEIAEALHAAHASGIVHRDLKPANIFVVEGDHAKVLDFGLAKLMQGAASGGSDPAQTPTALGTVAGVIMGTAGYMAPEQIRGADIDQRTDLFAFGCVLYEMVSGARAFAGGTAVEVLNAILNSDPVPLAEIDSSLPRDLVRLIDRCMAKDPSRRYQSSEHLLVELAAVSEDVARDSALSIGSFMLAEAKERPSLRWTPRSLGWPAIVAAVVLTAAVVGYVGRDLLRSSEPPAPAPVTRFSLSLPAEQELTQSAWTLPLALSPDSRRLAYTAGRPSQLFLHDFDAGAARPIPGTDNGDAAVFSPDGEWVAFFESLSRLKRVRLATGEVQDVCECRYDGGSVVWRPDDVIVYVKLGRTRSGELLGVPATGGVPRTLVAPTIEASGDSASVAGDPAPVILPAWLTLLPDGETLLALIYSDAADEGAFIGVATADGWRRLSAPGFIDRDVGGPFQYVPSGHLVYMSTGLLTAVAFDPERLEFLGNPTVVNMPVDQPLSYGSPAFFAVSLTGSLVTALPRPASARSSLVWVDRGGVVAPLRATAGEYSLPRLSPDGTELTVDSGAHVWMIDLERDTETRLSDTKSAIPGHAAWSRDGTEAIFVRGVTSTRLSWVPTDNSGAPRATATEGILWPTAWAPDGRLLMTRIWPPDSDIVSMPFAAEGEPLTPVAVVETDSKEGSAYLSPDGRWLAYTSNESGPFEVYAQPYPGPGRRWTISTSGGTSPAWSADGRELFYRDGSRMMSVAVEPGPALNPGRPRVLFDNPALLGVQDDVGRNYDVAADGQRFVMVQAPGPWAPKLNVVLNWYEELRTRVPATR